jgi:hypothetical protein
VLYYYHNETMPIFLLALFLKKERDNLTRGERNDLAKAMETIVKEYKRGRGK